MNAPLTGIIPPMITPLAQRDQLDVAGLERLIEHQIGGGVHGLLILGTCGEASALSGRLRRELIDRTCGIVAGRIPVLVGVTDTSVAESIDLARHAAESGAAAVAVSAPYYLPLEQEELMGYVLAVVAEQPLPVLLYNMPALTGTEFAPDTVERLAGIPKIIGIKDSSGNPAYLTGLQQRIGRKDWSFLVGTELLMADAVMAGAHGGVAGGALIAPKLFVSLYQAAVNRDRQRIAAMEQGLHIIDRIYRFSAGAASIIRGLKGALGCMGICSDRMAEPHRSCDDLERRTVGAHLAELGLQIEHLDAAGKPAG